MKRRNHLRQLIAAIFVCAVCAVTAAASYGTGSVTDVPLNVRSGPGTGHGILTTLQTGAKVEILSAAEDGWYKISSNGTEGYVSAAYLSVSPAEQEAIVQADSLYLRAGPGTSHAALGTAARDMTVIVIGAPEGGWYKVRMGALEGYMSAEYLLIGAPEVSAEAAAPAEPENGVVNTATLNVRAGPGTSYDRIAVLSQGVSVRLLSLADGWYHIAWNDSEGYVSAEYITPAGSGATGAAAQILETAKGFLGTRYVYGGAAPGGFDCSGFTNYVFRQHGYTLNRGASSQLKNGSEVDFANLQAGDLVFFRAKGSSHAATHVGIYIGNGQFIHASSTARGVIISELASGYYRSIFTTGRHIV